LTLKFSESAEIKVKKEGWGGGSTKQIKFVAGQGDLAVLKPSSKVLFVAIGSGLPKNSRPGIKVHHPSAGRSNPNVVKSAHNIPHQSVKNNYNISNSRRARPPPPTSEPPQFQPVVDLPISKSHHQNSTSLAKQNSGNSIKSNFKVPSFSSSALNQIKLRATRNDSRRDSQNEDYLKTPEAGVAGLKRESLRKNRPLPGGGRPKPLKPKPTLPKCRTLYSYDAQDTDELSFAENDIIEIVKEDPGGWWVGKLRGKEGLFPANYIEKM